MTIKPKIFKPETFYNESDIGHMSFEQAAAIANRIIESKLGPKVYGWGPNDGAAWSPYHHEQQPYSAYLFDIQKLPEKVCEHEPPLNELFMKFGLLNAKCRHCSIELTAKWEAKK